MSHLHYNEFGVPRDSNGHTGVIGFVEASVTGILRRPWKDNSVGSLWTYPPLPIISGREEPLESKAEASEYRVGLVAANLEQAAEFEQQQSDSDGETNN